MSVFDPNTFMESNVTEAGSTSVEPIPQGTYKAMIDDVVARSVTTASGQRIVVDVTYNLLEPELTAKLGRQKLTVKQGIFVDTTENGDFDMSKGKNVQLNKVRDALGQNVAGKPWNLNMLKGAGPLQVIIKLRPDKNSPDVIYNDVATVGKMK